MKRFWSKDETQWGRLGLFPDWEQLALRKGAFIKKHTFSELA